MYVELRNVYIACMCIDGEGPQDVCACTVGACMHDVVGICDEARREAHSTTDCCAASAPGEAPVGNDSAADKSVCVGVVDCSAPAS